LSTQTMADVSSVQLRQKSKRKGHKQGYEPHALSLFDKHYISIPIQVDETEINEAKTKTEKNNLQSKVSSTTPTIDELVYSHESPHSPLWTSKRRPGKDQALVRNMKKKNARQHSAEEFTFNITSKLGNTVNTIPSGVERQYAPIAVNPSTMGRITYTPWIPPGSQEVQLSDKLDNLMQWEDSKHLQYEAPVDRTRLVTTVLKQNIIRNSFENFVTTEVTSRFAKKNIDKLHKEFLRGTGARDAPSSIPGVFTSSYKHSSCRIDHPLQKANCASSLSNTAISPSNIGVSKGRK
jgi:hypothetical protein